MLKILNKSLQPQAILQYLDSPLISEEINGGFVFRFRTVIDNDKSQYINENFITEIENNYFNIVAYEKNANSDGTLTIDVECEHVSYDLMDDENIMESFISYGTPAQIIAELFQGTPFTVGTVEITAQDYISLNEMVTKRDALITIAKTFGGELKFDKYEVSLLNRRGADRGVRFMYRKNLLNCKYAVDSREKVNGLPKVSVEVDVAELEFANGGMPDEHYELGDDVTVIHGSLQVNIPERIVKVEYNPFLRIQGKVSIGSRIKDITDTIVSLQRNTVVKERIYNGCKIGPENGFEAVRNDNKVKSTLNATEGISVKKGDGSGDNWNNAFYVDTDGNIHLNNAFIELVTGVVSMLLDPSVGIKISDANGDLFSVDTTTGQLNMNGDLTIKQAGNKIAQVFKDTFGGVMKVYDSSGLLEAKIGVQSGTQSNIGGTLILYLNAPYDTGDLTAYQRVEMGSLGDGSGAAVFRDNLGRGRIGFTANPSAPMIGVADEAGNMVSFITPTYGRINLELIATQPYVDNKITQHIAQFHSGII